jgi:hypothetical protein
MTLRPVLTKAFGQTLNSLNFFALLLHAGVLCLSPGQPHQRTIVLAIHVLTNIGKKNEISTGMLFFRQPSKLNQDFSRKQKKVDKVEFFHEPNICFPRSFQYTQKYATIIFIS